MYVCSIRRLIKVGEMSVFDTYSNFNTNKTQSTTSLDGYLASPASTGNLSYKSKVSGQSVQLVECINSSSPNIDTLTVESSTDVAFGNRIFFIQSGPDDGVNTPKQFYGIRRLYRNNRFFVCWISTTFSVIMAALIVMACFSHVNVGRPDKPSACEEIPSIPSYLTCDYVPSCTQCGTLYPGIEICQSYYTANCGEIRCFCKPGCADCRYSV